ncbi:ArsR/SmtB family transcription factor [Streptomyces xiamenensis]|uniref:ArsR/SmtB family transcription factor n=1 Tax=Streptomyces xiamenensis TaxID=408015 RepID=UPI0037D0F719
MLRVHFTPEDIARVRLATVPDPLWEMANSFSLLGQAGRNLAFGEWRRRALPRLTGFGRLLPRLLPARGYFPDFLTPGTGGGSCSEPASAIDRVLATPRRRLHRDLVRLAASPLRRRPLPHQARTLAEGDPEALRLLGAELHAYHRAALGPFWPRVRAQVDADRAMRTRALLEGGVEGLLGSFRPMMHWRPPVLEVDYPAVRELRLDGRGLVLQPSFFCVRRPITLVESEGTPVLVHPIQHTLGWADGESAGPRSTALSALIGRTRAALLEELEHCRSTGELARLLSVSEAAVSQHTGVLRAAGLLSSVRHGRSVLHAITPAGLALLASPRGAPVNA